jgi:hypothetical protein
MFNSYLVNNENSLEIFLKNDFLISVTIFVSFTLDKN